MKSTFELGDPEVGKGNPVFNKCTVLHKFSEYFSPYFHQCLSCPGSFIPTRVVESKSLKVGESLKIGKNRIKSEKSEFIFY